MSDDDINVYSEGLVWCSVCAPRGMQREVIESRVNFANPTGIGSPWRISRDSTFRNGQANPCQCDTDPDRVHYLMSC